MIWHPGSIALLLGSGSAALLVLLSLPFIIRTLRRWDFSSTSEAQYALEKSTYLISTLIGWAVSVNAASLFLFAATANDFSKFLVGAMCATGALNANPIGWYVLLLKGLLLVLGIIWVLFNNLDNTSPDFGLIRFKYGFLLALCPLFLADFFLLWRYLSGLTPDVITSCCGSLFSTAAKEPKSILAALSPKKMMAAHHGAVILLWLSGAWAVWGRGAAPKALYSLLSFLFLPFALAGTVAFIAPHIYQLPFHHCPFDTLQGEYHYLGFPLFISLFAATAWGVMPGLALVFRGRKGIAKELPRFSDGWMRVSLGSRALFDILTYYVVFGNGLTLY